MLKSYILSITLIFSTITGFSQNLFKYAYENNVEVVKNNGLMLEPWGGGMNNPQFNELDVNFDCVNDLVIFEKSGNIVRVFINDNTANEPSYHYAPEYAKFFPETLSDFLLIRDYNNDGKPDLFTYRIGALMVFKNVSDSTLKFELYTEKLPAIVYGDSATNVYTIPIDYPVIDDINGDGLIDILSVNVFGIFINLYENVSTHPDTMWVESSNTCWGNFYENQLNDSLVLGATCKGGPSNSAGAQRHSGASMLTLDLYGNGSKDLLLGDVGYSNLTRLQNGGTPNSANMITVDYHYDGDDSKEVVMPTFPVSFFMDVNNNGRKDLIVSTNQVDGGIDTGNVWFYDNFGANNNPTFQHNRDNLLVGDQMDVGTGAFPVLADISGDGLPDLMVGNLGYFLSYDDNTFQTEYTGRIAYYKNIGNDSVPKFEFVTDDLAGLSSKNFKRIAPAFADLDADGDMDLLFGENNGSLSFYRNIAPPGQMADFVLVADTFMGQFFGVQPSPFLYDIDGDNALDLLVGQKNGNIQLFINQGDSTNPLYTLSATDTLGGIYNYYVNYQSNAMPFIGKIDGSGANVLVVADGIGNLLYYDGIDNNWMGNFTMIDSMRVSKSYIGVTGADLTGNDTLELIVGERPGGLMYLNIDEEAYNYSPYPRDTCVIDAIWEWNERKSNNFDIIPNPNNGDFRIHLELTTNSNALVSVYDLSGKIVNQTRHSVVNGLNDIELSNRNLKPGVYIVQVQIDGSVYRSKLIIQ